ncbi:MAG TPA: DUF4147 domain-containing protein [Candidatus Paceibacterota bacterium]
MGQIQNFEELAVSGLRCDALRIAEAGYGAINTEKVVSDKVKVENGELHIGDKKYDIAGRKLFYVGIGKCAISAGRAIEKLLGESLTAGVALDVADTSPDSSSKIKTYIGTHPLPSEANVLGAKRIIEFLSDKKENDLVIMIISGGGSTLLCLPDSPMTSADESKLFKELTARGAPIRDINTVRKHLSRARGGTLAVAAYPAEVVSLIFSDVSSNDIETVASGPTVLNASMVADAQNILAKYGIQASENVSFIETPKEQKYFERVTNILFLSNQDALIAMSVESVKRGYEAKIMNDNFTGEAREVGRAVIEELHESPPNTALLYAGESTVALGTSSGKGGRNQEMALSTLEDIKEDELILPFASDGHDNTDRAGAIADEMTRAHAREKNLSSEEHLNSHRAYDFFSTTGDAIVTGYTGSNVSDLIVALKK